MLISWSELLLISLFFCKVKQMNVANNNTQKRHLALNKNVTNVLLAVFLNTKHGDKTLCFNKQKLNLYAKCQYTGCIHISIREM